MLKNVTITLDEEVAAWARVEAAKAGKSLSRFLGDLLAEKRGRLPTQQEALERFLSGPDYPGISADRPSREELYAERLFRRHERPALHEGPDGSEAARPRGRVARRTRPA